MPSPSAGNVRGVRTVTDDDLFRLERRDDYLPADADPRVFVGPLPVQLDERITFTPTKGHRMSDCPHGPGEANCNVPHASNEWHGYARGGVLQMLWAPTAPLSAQARLRKRARDLAASNRAMDHGLTPHELRDVADLLDDPTWGA